MPQRLLIRSVVSNYKYVRKRSHLNPMIIVDISDNNSVTKHLNKRKANAYAKLNKLESYKSCISFLIKYGSFTKEVIKLK